MIRRSRIVIVLALVAALGAMTIAGVSSAAGATTIKVADNVFNPDKKSVGKGTKVKFKWVGSNPHNVTKSSGPGDSFASDTTSNRGVNFSKKFKKTGKYKLICTIHERMKMTLKVK